MLLLKQVLFFQVPRRGWWVTGGINENEREGISTTDLYNTGNDYGSNQPVGTWLLGPILPERLSHHCLIQRTNSVKYILIGGSTPKSRFSTKVLHDKRNNKASRIAMSIFLLTLKHNVAILEFSWL